MATIAFGRSTPAAALAIDPGTVSERLREHTPAFFLLFNHASPEFGAVAPPAAGRYVWHSLLEPPCQITLWTLQITGQLQATSAVIVKFRKVGVLHRQKLYAVCKPSAACEHQWCGALANVCYIRTYIYVGTKLSVVAQSLSYVGRETKTMSILWHIALNPLIAHLHM